MSAPRRHHIVPELYQKGFARQRGKGWFATVVVRSTGEVRGPMNITNIFVERDYNTVIDADGCLDFSVEQLLAHYVETGSVGALDALRASEFPLTAADTFRLAIFMAAQLSRGRGIRESFRARLGEAMSMALTLAAQNASDEHFEDVLGHPLSPEERERMVNNRDHITIEPTNAVLLNAALSSVEEIAEILLKRTWTLVVFPEPCLFSGEHPVVHINPSGDDLGYGVMTAERLYMPVSTTVALVLSHPWAGWQEEVVHEGEGLARRLNWAMLTHPSNNELLLHPDICKHPLPSVLDLMRGVRWPWGPDPASAHPLGWRYAAEAQARRAELATS